jgi:hypothetical protein
MRTLCSPITTALTADATGQNVATAQNVFPTNGTFAALDRTTYRFEALYIITRAAGTTAHTTAVLFNGTATQTAIDYLAEASSTTGNVLGAPSHITASAAATTTATAYASVIVTASSTSATENIRVRLTGMMRVNVGGTIIPQFLYSAVPGGAPTIKRGSFFQMMPLGHRDGAMFGIGWS